MDIYLTLVIYYFFPIGFRYSSMTYIVDQLFPPNNSQEETFNEFSNVNYWRDPISSISDDTLNNLNEIIESTVEIAAMNLADNN